jgi:hypothetical protein
MMDVVKFDKFLTGLTRHQLRLLETLYKLGDQWVTRGQIARALQKRCLVPYDIEILDMFIREGIAEGATKPFVSPITDIAHIYRISEDVAELVEQWVAWRDEQRERRSLRQSMNFAQHLALD